MAMDAASEGNFKNKRLIENLVISNNIKNDDLDRKRLVENLDGSQIDKIKAKLDCSEYSCEQET